MNQSEVRGVKWRGGWGGDCKGLPDVHVFHAHYYVFCFILKGTVESNDVLGIAIMHDAQLAYNPLTNLVLGLDMNDLFPISTSPT